MAILLAGPLFQVFASLSDRVGRKKVILSGLVLSAVLIPVVFYYFLQIANPDGVKEVHEISTLAAIKLIGLTFLLNAVSAMVYGPIGAFMLELFPTRIRYTSMGFAYNIGNGVLGGSTTLIAELLRTTIIVSAVLSPFVGLIYPMALIVIAIIVNATSVPETYRNNITD